MWFESKARQVGVVGLAREGGGNPGRPQEWRIDGEVWGKGGSSSNYSPAAN